MVVAVGLDTAVLTKGILTTGVPREEGLLYLVLTKENRLNGAAFAALVCFVVDTSDMRLALQEMAQGSILADPGFLVQQKSGSHQEHKLRNLQHCPHWYHHRFQL